MPQAATIKGLPRAFRMMKAMQAQGIEWGEDYRRAGGVALKDVLEGRMASGIGRHLADMAARARPGAGGYPPSSHHTGVWSDGLSRPRGARSTSHVSSRSAACGDSRRWSMRSPSSRCQRPF